MKHAIVEKIRSVYTKRLLEALSEVDVTDKEGNVLISKDLKVLHKDSGFEYTVDDVAKTPSGIAIVLRQPDDPRIEPPPASTILDELDDQLTKFITPLDTEEEAGDLFVVDEKSFEKEYEVK